MRGGKRGAHKGRERVLAENEDDIIARNMMVDNILMWSLQEREERKRRNSDEDEETSSEANESNSEPDMDAPRRRVC